MVIRQHNFVPLFDTKNLRPGKLKTLFSNNWVSVKETEKGFAFLERKGKDSVAVFLIRECLEEDAGEDDYEVLVRYQPLCIDNVWEDGDTPDLFPCPITGSIDDGESPIQTAARESKEESGYSVDGILNGLDFYIVGTQTNEIVHLFYANVTGIEPEVAQQDGSIHEAVSKNVWEPLSNLRLYPFAACRIGYLMLLEELGLQGNN